MGLDSLLQERGGERRPFPNQILISGAQALARVNVNNMYYFLQ